MSNRHVNEFLDPDVEFSEEDFQFRSSGQSVKDLQQALIDLGYDLPEYGADGTIGRETVEAVDAFENDFCADYEPSFAVRGSTLEAVRYRYTMLKDPEPPPSDRGSLPCKGKHMYIRSLSQTGEPNDEFRVQCQTSKIRGIWVQRIWQNVNGDTKYLNGTLFDTYRPVIEELGLELWVWGYPQPDQQSEFIDAMTQTCEEWNCKGMVIDVEGAWRGASDATAGALVNGLKSIKKPVGFSSFGAPWNFPTMPWYEFSDKCDWGNPQIYDDKDDQPSDYPERCVESWREKGFKDIIPASSAYKSYEGMVQLLSETPAPDEAIVWWDWYNANLRPERWDAITEYAGV